jgi:hypothetical protein
MKLKKTKQEKKKKKRSPESLCALKETSRNFMVSLGL